MYISCCFELRARAVGFVEVNLSRKVCVYLHFKQIHSCGHAYFNPNPRPFSMYCLLYNTNGPSKAPMAHPNQHQTLARAKGVKTLRDARFYFAFKWSVCVCVFGEPTSILKLNARHECLVISHCVAAHCAPFPNPQYKMTTECVQKTYTI